MTRPSALLALILLLLALPLTALAADEDSEGEGDSGDSGDTDDDDGDSEAPPWAQDSGEDPPTVTQAPPPASAPAMAAQLDWKDLSTLKGGGALGLGFVLGTSNGVSLKIWPARAHGIVLHLGVPNRLNNLALHLSYRIHVKPVIVPNSPVAIHFQLGPQFRTRIEWGAIAGGSYAFIELAGGLVLGTSITIAGAPVEFFAEVAPSFGGGVSPAGVGVGFDVDGLAGARFYFGGKN